MTGLSLEIKELLKAQPMMFSDLLRHFRDRPYRQILLAWSELRETGNLERTRPEGGYYWKDA